MKTESTVLEKVFQEFIARLKADATINPAAIKRLQEDVIEKRTLKTESIKAALFSEDTLS